MTPPRPWRSGFCNTDDADPWQHTACDRAGGGHRRTPTKADPRTWVPCACTHHHPEEPPMTETTTAPPAELTLDQAVAVFAAAADQLSETTTRTLMGTDWQHAIRLLDTLRAAGRTAGQVDATLVRHAYLTGEHGKTVLDGIGVVNITRSRERKAWDERGVARAVIDAHMAAAENLGVAPDPWDVAEWLLEVYGVNYVRVTPLRTLGLEPAAFCEELPGKPTVQLPPRG